MRASHIKRKTSAMTTFKLNPIILHYNFFELATKEV